MAKNPSFIYISLCTPLRLYSSCYILHDLCHTIYKWCSKIYWNLIVANCLKVLNSTSTSSSIEITGAVRAYLAEHLEADNTNIRLFYNSLLQDIVLTMALANLASQSAWSGSFPSEAQKCSPQVSGTVPWWWTLLCSLATMHHSQSCMWSVCGMHIQEVLTSRKCGHHVSHWWYVHLTVHMRNIWNWIMILLMWLDQIIYL